MIAPLWGARDARQTFGFRLAAVPGAPCLPSGGVLRFGAAKDGRGRSERLSALGRQPCTQRAVLRPWLGWPWGGG
jgi:hypothetical protein